MLVETLTTCTKSEVESKANAVRHTIELAVTSIDEVDTEALAQQFADAAGEGVDVSDVEVVAEVVNVVKQEVTIKGDINSFNITAFTEAIAAVAGVPVEDVSVELKPVETRRRRLDGARRLSEGAAAGGEFKAEATIETKDETVAQAAKEKLAEKVSDKEAASELLGVEVAEDPPPPVDEQKVEVTTTILAEDALAEADVVSNLEDKLGTAEEASDVLGMPVAEVAAVRSSPRRRSRRLRHRRAAAAVVAAASEHHRPYLPEGTERDVLARGVGDRRGGGRQRRLVPAVLHLYPRDQAAAAAPRTTGGTRRWRRPRDPGGRAVGGDRGGLGRPKRLYEGQMMERG